MLVSFTWKYRLVGALILFFLFASIGINEQNGVGPIESVVVSGPRLIRLFAEFCKDSAIMLVLRFLTLFTPSLVLL
jgi:hypothetical protein